MTPLVLVGIGLLGGLGCVARVAAEASLTTRLREPFPVAILAVNVSGSLVLGVLVGQGVGGDAMRLLGLGLLGGYTTFSGWMADSHRLAREGRPGRAAANVVASLAVGLAAVWLGRELGRLL